MVHVKWDDWICYLTSPFLQFHFSAGWPDCNLAWLFSCVYKCTHTVCVGLQLVSGWTVYSMARHIVVCTLWTRMLIVLELVWLVCNVDNGFKLGHSIHVDCAMYSGLQVYFSVKIFRCRDEPIKRMETRQRQKYTRRLSHYGNMVEKKNTWRLPCICCLCNRCRVVCMYFSFPPYFCSGIVFLRVSSWPCFHPFYRFFPTSKDFVPKSFIPCFYCFWWVCFAECNRNHPCFFCASFCNHTR